jgi:hypothetical protein
MCRTVTIVLKVSHFPGVGNGKKDFIVWFLSTQMDDIRFYDFKNFFSGFYQSHTIVEMKPLPLKLHL